MRDSHTHTCVRARAHTHGCPPSSVAPAPRAPISMCAGPDEGVSPDSPTDGREAALRRLAATDAPTPKPTKAAEAKDVGPSLPEWVYFALPIAGAVVAFAWQYFTKAPLPVG